VKNLNQKLTNLTVTFSFDLRLIRYMKILLIIAALFAAVNTLRMFIPLYYPVFKKAFPQYGIKFYLWNTFEALLVNGFVFYAIYKLLIQ